MVSYNFDDNLFDTSGNGNHASLVSGSATYVDSASGKAISLNGSQHLVMPNDLIRNQSNFTFTVKFRAQSGASGGILGYQNVAATTTATEWIPLINIDTNGKIRVELWTNSGGMSLTSTASVDDGNWHTVVMTGDVG